MVALIINPVVPENTPPVAPVKVTFAVVEPEQYGDPEYVIVARTGELITILVVVEPERHPKLGGIT